MRANLLLLFCSLALMALLMEGILRLFYAAPPTWKDPQILHLKSPRLGWVLPAGGKGYTIDAPVQVNSLGLRDDEFPIRRPPGETRILALGDSFTFALGVRFEDLYVQKLENALAKRVSRGSVQVVNAGVAGYNTRQELVYLLTQGLELDPQLVIVGFYWNDLLGNEDPLPEPGTPLLLDEPKPRGGEGHLIPSPARNLLRQSLLIYLGVTSTKRVLQGMSGEESELQRVQHALLSGEEAILAPYWEPTGRRLREIAQACGERSIPVVLVAFPSEIQIHRGVPESVWSERLEAIWGPTGMPLVDLEPHYRESLARGENPFLPYDLHPGPLGMQIAADAILEAIDDAGLLDAERVAEQTP